MFSGKKSKKQIHGPGVENQLFGTDRSFPHADWILLDSIGELAEGRSTRRCETLVLGSLPRHFTEIP